MTGWNRSVMLLFSAVIALALSGCNVARLTINTPLTPESVAFIAEGRTTLADVVDTLGAPDSITDTETGTIVTYRFLNAKQNLGKLVPEQYLAHQQCLSHAALATFTSTAPVCLKAGGDAATGWGYAVFGKVISGADVVDKIKAVKTGRKGFHDDVPKDDVVLEKAVAL